MERHVFNPIAKEVGTGVIWLGGERDIRQEERREMQFEEQCSLSSLRTGLPL